MRVLAIVVMVLVSRSAAAEGGFVYIEPMVLAGGNQDGVVASFRTSLGVALVEPTFSAGIDVRFGVHHELVRLTVPFQGTTDEYILPAAGAFLEIGGAWDRNVLAGHLSLTSIGGARAQDGPERVALGVRFRRDSLVIAGDAFWQSAPGEGIGFQAGIGVTPRPIWGKTVAGVVLAGAIVAGFVASFGANTH